MKTLVSTSSTEPVTLAQAKLHLKMDDISTDDTLITSLITAARQRAEKTLNLDIVEKTWDYKLAAFPADEIAVPNAPVKSVTSIKYIDDAGVEQTVSTDVYAVHPSDVSPTIYLKYDQDWPAARAQEDAVTIRFVTGFTTVPEPIRAAILMIIASMYEHRSGALTGVMITKTPQAPEMLLAPYRRLRA